MSESTDLIDGAHDAAPSDEAAAESATAPRSRRRGSGLSGMLLPELQRLAGELGIPGTGKMRKSDLVAAISERQVGGAPAAEAPAAAPATAPDVSAPRADEAVTGGAAASAAPLEAPVSGGANSGPVTGTDAASTDAASTDAASTDAASTDAAPTGRRRRAASRPAGAPTVDSTASTPDAPASPVAADEVAQPTAAEGTAEDTDQAPPADTRTGGDRPQRSRNRDRAERAPREGGEREERTAREDRNRDAGNRDERVTRDSGTREDRAREDRPREDRPREDRPRDAGNRDADNRDERGNRDSGNREDRSRGSSRDERGNRDGADRDGEQRGGRDRTDGESGRPGRNNRDGNRTDGPGNRGDAGANRNDTRGDTRGEARTDEDDDDFEGGRGRRGRRYRDRNRRGGSAGGRERFDQGEPTVSEDDVLLPVAGILDVLDSYAFVRTSGYLTGPNDVYVSLSQVRRYGLRRGDAITGAVRQPREGEKKDKYNALVRLDSVNGLDPEQARNRPEFTKLTPLYPQDRLRLETESHLMTTRLIDLVMPIGKGQRALIVSPPKAGKTMVLQSIANAITTNNPEVHLMVVLVDERPEEVTDMQRSVKGEVIASTFDRPPADHTTVAELSIERAKRLVEMGHDVVVLLDSITRLGRAYNLAAPASGRILSGGVDSTALYPPKRFLGAARNIENGGSLTIIASALVETGSTMDTVIFEEFKGTGNAEIKLDRRLADKRVFPAVDVNASGTRKEEILLSPDELAIIIKLRRVLSALEPQQALELLLDRMRKTRNNIEFLMQVQKTTLGVNEKD
ncbi:MULTISPECIES: transcription termination factor Rho [unclassified Modestobacter]|uniref:transcription termination factor Rho n=1 Tax=unclassified Modestobacter TaxID=2643866 RepID=UPI0022AAAB1B|nr:MULTISPECIES: transcription termination factor Rho [unclassified Modestobacter]MCZ2823944.1 transcription termination factor Rho [Modestobacter sp. VKM Ac-2981]MCZ2852189.1 transcription termination factor Rho [Modestobacter sp. VKM Ac-2982]